MNDLSATDAAFLRSFEGNILTAATFRHREHLRLAYIYLTLHPFEDALQTMRVRLRAFLKHLGAPPIAYHETMTRAWFLAVNHFMHRCGTQESSDRFLSVGAVLLDKDVMYTHYTRGLLQSEAARASFVEPDLDPIPRHV